MAESCCCCLVSFIGKDLCYEVTFALFVCLFVCFEDKKYLVDMEKLPVLYLFINRTLNIARHMRV